MAQPPRREGQRSCETFRSKTVHGPRSTVQGPESCFAINILLKGSAHDTQRRWLTAPDFQRLGALMEKHSNSIGCAATNRTSSRKERRFRRPINHVVNRRCITQCEFLLIEWKGIALFQSKRRGIEQQVHLSR